MTGKKRFFNMYLTTTISVALVLFLVGMECVVLLSTHQLIRNLKENVTLTILLAEDVDSTQIARLGELLQGAPYSAEVQFISKAQALEEHIASLGEDPQKFLGYNPLSDSYEVNLCEQYAVEDSIVGIAESLKQIPYISSVNHPQEIVSVLDLQVGRVNIMLVAVALVLLLIAVVLIINTVRLHVYSKRFIINTMRLVGATSWVIRAPFIKRNLRMGLEASVLALIAVVLAVFVVYDRFGVLLFDMTWQNILGVTLVVIAVGELITFVASLIATGKYIRMKTDMLYEI